MHGIPPMEYIESKKNFGVVIGNKLTFEKHIYISEKINNVQRRASINITKLTYEERLRKLKLPTLAYRRL